MKEGRGRATHRGFVKRATGKARVYPFTDDFFQRRVRRRRAVWWRLRIASCVRGNAANDEALAVVLDDADSSACARRFRVGVATGRRRGGGRRRARLVVVVRYAELDTASCRQSSPSVDAYDPLSIASDDGSGTYNFVLFRSTRLALRERCSGVSRCRGK